MPPPAFWHRPPGLSAWLLAPPARIWAARTAARVARPPLVRPGIPVICVGNLTAGGTGKTPVVIALLERLRSRTPHALSRGYGGRLPGPTQVDPARHSAADVGDEPLLLSAFAPAWVARARAEGARAAEDAGAGLIVMDDGHQNPDVAKTLSIVVVDADAGFGNARVIPAGPLREPVASGLSRADFTITLGSEPAKKQLHARYPELSALPSLSADLKPLATGMPWRGLRVLAFAGIGRPAKFFGTLKALGAEIVATRSFDDHAPYARPLALRLLRDAAAKGARAVTTEKDAVRWPADLRAEVLTLPVRLEAADWSPLDRALSAL